MPARKKPVSTSAAGEQPLEWLHLSELTFDQQNPRFGDRGQTFKADTAVVDFIADKVGIDEILSSLAVNGYFLSEPLVAIRRDGKTIIVEGNRRLAACLILNRDPRAKNQRKRQEQYGLLNAKHGGKSSNPVPVIVFEGADAMKRLLPFLGVRHVVGMQDWDSYAKAAWVARAMKEGGFSVDDLIEMIGDDNRQSERILEAYHLIHQLIDQGRFEPEDSMKGGRGSQAEFPFSVVYNAMGNSAIRKWIGLEKPRSGLQSNPVPKAFVSNAADVVRFICGSRSQKIPPVIKESRQLTDLAVILSRKDATQIEQLRRGTPVADVAEDARPTMERVVAEFSSARESLERAVKLLGRGQIALAQARELVQPGLDVQELAKSAYAAVIRATNQ